MTRSFEARLARIEKSRPVIRMLPDPGQARGKLAALVETAGGRLPGESLAMATARVLGIPERELMNHLRERAAACR